MAIDNKEAALSETLYNNRVNSFVENISVLQFGILILHLISFYFIVRNIIKIPKNGTNYYLLSFTFGIIAFYTAVFERYLRQILEYDWNFGETLIGCKLYSILTKIDTISLLTVLALLIHWVVKISFSWTAKQNKELYLSLSLIFVIWELSLMNVIPKISILNVKYENNVLNCDSDKLRPISNWNNYELMTLVFPICEIFGLLYCYIFVIIIGTNINIKKHEACSPDAQLLKCREKTCSILVGTTASFFFHLLVKSIDHLYGQRRGNYNEEPKTWLINIFHWLPLEVLLPILVISTAIIYPILCIKMSQRSNKLSYFESVHEYSPVPIYTIDVRNV